METAPLKRGKIMLRNNIFSSPNVESMVFVKVTIDTLAEVRLSIFTQDYTWSFRFNDFTLLTMATVSDEKV